MPKRVKPNLSPVTFPVHSLDDVDAALAQIAARKRQIDLIGLGVAEQVDEIKTRAAAETEPIRLEIAALELAIGVSPKRARRNCSAKRSPCSSSSGIVGFRASSKLKTLKKWTFERVLATLRDTGMREYIRVKEEVDKEKLKGLAPETLAGIGCTVVQEDVFYYELPEQPEPETQPSTL